MAYFTVSYQLNNQKDYQPLWDEMKRLKAHKAMRDYYLLDVNSATAVAVRDHLRAFIDHDDMIFVAKLDSKPGASHCYQGTNNWISDRF